MRLNHYNFWTIQAIDFIFSPLHTTPFLFRIISIADDIKINEQNKSIATGLVYVQTDLKAILKLLSKDMAVLTPVGYQTMQLWKEIQDSKKKFYDR